MGLEFWNPRSGCLEEGELRNQAWVRILGLPISLWVPSILRRVGEVCGGFLAIDPLTEKMEELQWARILVKSNGEDLPSSSEIRVEKATYHLSLWWEVLPSLRQNTKNCSGSTDRPSGEVRGEVDARVCPRVEEMENAQLETQFQSADGTRGQVNGAGIEAIVNRVQNGSMTRPSFDFSVAGPSLSGLVVGLEGSKRVVGPSSQSPSLKEDVDGGVGPASGLSCSKGKGWAAIEVNASPIEPSFLLRESPGRSQAQLTASGLSLKAQSSMCNSELEFIKMREKED